MAHQENIYLRRWKTWRVNNSLSDFKNQFLSLYSLSEFKNQFVSLYSLSDFKNQFVSLSTPSLISRFNFFGLISSSTLSSSYLSLLLQTRYGTDPPSLASFHLSFASWFLKSMEHLFIAHDQTLLEIWFGSLIVMIKSNLLFFIFKIGRICCWNLDCLKSYGMDDDGRFLDWSNLRLTCEWFCDNQHLSTLKSIDLVHASNKTWNLLRDLYRFGVPVCSILSSGSKIDLEFLIRSRTK